MGRVALELLDLGSTWPGLPTDLRAFELTHSVLRKGEPETCRVGTCGHVVAVRVVRIGDPETRHRVVGGQQDILGILARRTEVPAVRRRSEHGEVRRIARFGRMTFGLDRQVANNL